jgi:hypothetical protein
MSRATELKLTLKNETGVLARLCRDLADAGVNLLALSAPDAAGPSGGIHLLVTKRDQAEKALGKAGYSFVAEEVLFVEIKNKPGALAKFMEKLAKAGIGVTYAYATAHLRSQKTAVVIAVPPDHLDRASKLLG